MAFALNNHVSKTINGDHGRIEQRNVWLISDIQWLVERHPKWKTIKAIAIVDSTREVQGKISREQRLYTGDH